MLAPQLALFDPAPRIQGFTPRPYQIRASEAIDRRLATERGALVVQATGGGKTLLFCMQAVKRGATLVLAHRDTLIRQAHAKLIAASGDYVAIEKAEQRAFPCKYVVASIQTLRGARLDNFVKRFPGIEFIVIDEAHRATAKSYRDIVSRWPSAKVLGVTATPDRSDGVGLKAVFGDGVAHEYNILDATNDGWLTPIRFIPVQSNVNLDRVKLVGKGADRDFDQAQLDDAIVQEAGRIAESFVRAIQRHGKPGQRGIAFAPGVKTAHACAGAINEILPGWCGVVDGTMPDSVKRPIMDDHRAGRLKVIWNVGVLTEGYDDPGLSYVFDAAGTLSRLRAMQKWGRATRTAIDVDQYVTAEERKRAILLSNKPTADIYDLVMNSHRHDVVCGLDVLTDGKPIPDAVGKVAREILQKEGGSVDDALERARGKIEAKRRAAIAAKMVAAACEVTVSEPRSIFDRAGLEFIKGKLAPTAESKLPPKTYGFMKWRGIPVPPGCTHQQAQRLISLDKKRESKGLCRLGGVEWLRKHGIDAWKLTGREGRALKDAIIFSGTGSLTKEQVGKILLDLRGEAE